MSRRCRAGMRARVIAGRNHGAIVLVMRPHFGEDVSGCQWPLPRFPWVVTSLGAPLRCYDLNTGKDRELKMTVVYDDSELEPLPDAFSDLVADQVSKPARVRDVSHHRHR